MLENETQIQWEYRYTFIKYRQINAEIIFRSLGNKVRAHTHDFIRFSSKTKNFLKGFRRMLKRPNKIGYYFYDGTFSRGSFRYYFFHLVCVLNAFDYLIWVFLFVTYPEKNYITQRYMIRICLVTLFLNW